MSSASISDTARRPDDPAVVHTLATLSRNAPATLAAVATFSLVTYLALKGGGFDPVVSREVGMVAWFAVAVAGLFGLLGALRPSRPALIAVLLLTAFAAKIALGLEDTDSAQRTVSELVRVLTYLGVLVAAIAAGPRVELRVVAGAIAAAIGLVALLAVLSRLHPGWFPANDTAAQLPTTRNRLNYPINYWNGLAALVALGMPLLLHFGAAASRPALRIASSVALPVGVFAIYLTFSRGGVLAALVAIGVLLALHTNRLALVVQLIPAAAASAILIVATEQRQALADGLGNPAANAQGNEVLALLLVVLVASAFAAAALGLAARHGIGPRLRLDSVKRRRLAVASFAVAVVAALALGAPGQLRDSWQEFKRPLDTGLGAERFDSVSGSGRYQYWSTALDAAANNPWQGLGAGTFEFEWAENGSLPGSVRDAHSFYFEAAAELGYPGMLIALALLIGPVVLATLVALRCPRDHRAIAAAAIAAMSAFAFSAAIDWVWEIPVLPVCFFLLAAVGWSRRDRTAVASSAARRSGPLARYLIVAAALGAFAVIAIPYSATTALRDSQHAAEVDGDLARAYSRAGDAEDLQPYSALSPMQKALVLEAAGEYPDAVIEAQQAVNDEPRNWASWLVLSRMRAAAGQVGPAIAAFRQARSLNPRSIEFVSSTERERAIDQGIAG